MSPGWMLVSDLLFAVAGAMSQTTNLLSCSLIAAPILLHWDYYLLTASNWYCADRRQLYHASFELLAVEDTLLLRCDVSSLGNQIPTFRRYMASLSIRISLRNIDPWNLGHYDALKLWGSTTKRRRVFTPEKWSHPVYQVQLNEFALARPKLVK